VARPAAVLDRVRWSGLWNRLGARGEGIPIFEMLAQAYGEPARTYHNVDHLQHCLAQLDHHRAMADRPDEVEAGLWFHDAVYAPGKSDNEERSARLAEAALREGGVGAEVAQRIAQLVLATRHAGPAVGEDARLVCDVDLSILGSPPAAFDEFESRIRQEYRRVPRPLYRRSRAKILKGFLLRPSIYQTGAFRAQYEDQARKNLERAVAALGG
jgi:predicted metal-dependent HD superfamily phosphohydrolase